MEPESIHIENFCTIRDLTLQLNQPGLISVLGVNKDSSKAISNGSGKSSLLEALCWCLWDKTPTQRTGDEVVNRFVGKDCKVTVTLLDDSDRYTITRHRLDSRNKKPNDVSILKNGDPIGSKAKIKDVQEVINRVVGFDFQTFCVMMPGAGVKATGMTDLEIKELLESLLQTDQLSQAHENAKARSKEIERELTTATLQISHLNHELENLDIEIKQLEALESSFELSKQMEVSRLSKRIEELNAELALYTIKVDTLPELLSQLKVFNVSVQELDKGITELTGPFKIASQIHNTRIEYLLTQSTIISTQLKAVDSNIARVHSMETCEACLQPVSKEAVLPRLQKDYKHYSESLCDVNVELHTEKASLKEKETAFTQKVSSLSKERENKNSAIKLLESSIREVNSQQILKDRVQKELEQVQVSLAQAQSNHQDFEALFKAKEEKQLRIKQDLASFLVSQEKNLAEKKLCDFWLTGFSPAGLRSFMLDYVTPILNDRAEYYSNILTSGEMKVTFSTKTTLKSGEVRDKFQIIVEQKDGDNTYKGISKGEKARADLLVAMALGDLAAFRTAKQLPWRFFDEPFENIDEAGTDAIVKLLNDQRARYKTVFVITHKTSFKEMFNKSITIVKENGISSLQ